MDNNENIVILILSIISSVITLIIIILKTIHNLRSHHKI